ncbi:MAG: o-succinylbenzoate synthase [Chromatiales bacterium]|nr:o-succinylbenzoate synthase [Chromatiales bacterium]
MIRIINAFIHPYRLPLQIPWRTARGEMCWREGVLLELRGSNGYVGWGECAPLPAAGSETLGEALAGLELMLQRLAGVDLAAAWELLPKTPAACCALESALLDLQAQESAVSITEQLGGERCSYLQVNAIGGDLLRGAELAAESALAGGFKLVKFKVGVAEPEQEAACLRQLNDRFGDRLAWRLDANGAWDKRQAARFVEQIDDLNIESLEEPLKQPEAQPLQELQARAPFPLALDESLPKLGMETALFFSAVRRWVLKPTVLGGPRSTQRWITTALAAGIKPVITTTLESAVGVAHCAQVAALLPDGIHGLATSGWYREDLARALPLQQGCLSLPARTGVGVAPHCKNKYRF